MSAKTKAGSDYVELHAHSYYSLLDGASSPEALLDRAAALGMPALAMTDHDNLYGAIRFWQAANERGIQPIIGAEMTMAWAGLLGQPDGSDARGSSPTTTTSPERNPLHLILLAETQDGYANLCKLLSLAHMGELTPPTELEEEDTWPGKTPPCLDWESLNTYRKGLIALTGCRQGPLAAPLLAGQEELALSYTEHLRRIFGPRHLYVELQRHLLPDETGLLRGLKHLAAQLNLPVVATNNVHYAERAGQQLQDVMVCIQHLTSLDEAAGILRPNSEFYLKTAEEMRRLFPTQPEALRNTLTIAERCQISLDFSNFRLPEFPLPQEHTAFSYLYELCQAGLYRRYQPVTPAASKQLAYELDIIERTGLAGYFLIVWDIVRFAQDAGIRYQGRGSAANSLVAFLLEITPVDPLRFNLLFDRFLSEDSKTMPDIDIDFAADRRDEVIQYVYHRYGVEHTAMVCNVNTFRSRAAMRDVGRALGLRPEMIDQVQRAARVDDRGRKAYKDILPQRLDAGQEIKRATLSAWSSSEIVQTTAAEHEETRPHALLLQLCKQIQGAPRHLSIHVGGMIITAKPLNEIVPLERATMPGRVVTHWNKDSVEDAGLIKIDLLGLRTLGMVDEIAGLAEGRTGVRPALTDLRLDDPTVYDALCKADTIGVFQVESRAQSQMLPRMQPRTFEDIVVEVAIIRPGPIQGDMVHPYLRRRKGLEPVQYVHPALESVLGETLGVVLFQEQVLRVAMTLAGFSGGEADQLRRAMSRHRSDAEMRAVGEQFIAGAVHYGLEREEAVTIFSQLAGFASYGFCKSHAAAFALLAYQTMWLKLYYPAEFYCALLNHQPMGFYSPSVVMGDARRHGVIMLPPDLNCSLDDCTLEKDSIRLGLRYVKGFGPAARERLLALRATPGDSAQTASTSADSISAQFPYRTLRDLCIRTHLPRDSIETLIRAGTLDSLNPERRALLWELGTIDYRPRSFKLEQEPFRVHLPALTESESMAWSLSLLGATPGDHPMRLYRPLLQEQGLLSAAALDRRTDGDVVKVAGLTVVRQRPETAKGHLFITLEDETGLANLIIRPALYEKRRDILKYEPVIAVVGRLQKEGQVTSVLVFDVWPLSIPQDS